MTDETKKPLRLFTSLNGTEPGEHELLVSVAPGSPPAPFQLFDAVSREFCASELTARQVTSLARRHALRVVPIRSEP